MATTYDFREKSPIFAKIRDFSRRSRKIQKSRVTSWSKAKVKSAVSRISKIERSCNIYDHFDIVSYLTFSFSECSIFRMSRKVLKIACFGGGSLLMTITFALDSCMLSGFDFGTFKPSKT